MIPRSLAVNRPCGMHYAFDRWMRRTVPACPFARYADDAVVHSCSQRQAGSVKQPMAARVAACGLELHPDKPPIVYCKDSHQRGDYPTVQFTFLGFIAMPRKARNQARKFFTSFLPGASRAVQKRMCQQIWSWRLPRQTPGTLEELSQKYAAILTGWWNYYGALYPGAEKWRVDLTLAS